MRERINIMKENDWTKSICELLQKQDLGNNIYIDV